MLYDGLLFILKSIIYEFKNSMNFIFRKNWFPLSIQIIALIIFVFLIIGGFSANTQDTNFAVVLRNTNIANLFVWSYWWPLIIIGSVILGRIWCMICPVELITSLAAKFGFKRKIPAWLSSGWIITIFYVLILFIGIHTFAIHRIPYRMSIYLLSLVVVSIIAGLIFQKNTFCKNICPVGHLLGLYARLAPFGWSVKNKSVCNRCKDKSCIANRNLYNFQAKSCGVGLMPAKVDDNTDCLLCTQCVKSCEKFNPGQEKRPNPGLFKKSFARDILSLKSVSLAQSYFLMIVSGFVIYEILTEWSVTKTYLLWSPTFVQSFLGLQGVFATGIIKSIILFFILPYLLWSLPFFAFNISERKISFSSYLKNVAIAFIPIMASAHLVKALLKITSRIPYLKYSVSDPVGIDTARGIINKSIVLEANPGYFPNVITIISFMLITGGIFISLKVVSNLKRKFTNDLKNSYIFYMIPAVYGSIFLFMLIFWRF